MSLSPASAAGRLILVTGADGQVGHELQRSLAPLGAVRALTRQDLDLENEDAITQVVRESRPAAVVNAAAYTAVDRAEEEPELAMKINGTAPGVLASACADAGACLVHYSTDYVFDGGADRPYRETDATAPINTYGHSKLAGEENVLGSRSAAVVLRTSWVYAARGKNFLLTMLRLGEAQETLRVVDDQRGCPTPARYIAAATAALLANCDLAADRLAERRGLYHLSAAGETTWCGFARAIFAARRDEQVRVDAIPTTDFPTPAARPAYSVLATSRIADSFGIFAPDWRVLLEQVIDDMQRPDT